MFTRRRKIIAGLILLTISTPLFVYFCPGPIDGFWWNHSMDCMCDCHRFWRFHDGEVIEYREQHLPPIFVGTYRTVGWNAVEFNVSISNNRTERYVLHPGLFYSRFGQDGVHDFPLWGRVTSYLYRVGDDTRTRAMLEKARNMPVRARPSE